MTKGLDKDIQLVYEFVNLAVVQLEEVIDPSDRSSRATRLDEAVDRLYASLGILRDLQEGLEVDDEDLDFSGQAGRIVEDTEENDE